MTQALETRYEADGLEARLACGNWLAEFDRLCLQIQLADEAIQATIVREGITYRRIAIEDRVIDNALAHHHAVPKVNRILDDVAQRLLESMGGSTTTRHEPARILEEVERARTLLKKFWSDGLDGGAFFTALRGAQKLSQDVEEAATG